MLSLKPAMYTDGLAGLAQGHGAVLVAVDGVGDGLANFLHVEGVDRVVEEQRRSGVDGRADDADAGGDVGLLGGWREAVGGIVNLLGQDEGGDGGGLAVVACRPGRT